MICEICGQFLEYCDKSDECLESREDFDDEDVDVFADEPDWVIDPEMGAH